MIYFKNKDGVVFAFENEQEMQKHGEKDLKKMSTGEFAEYVNSLTVSSPVPQSVTRFQARAALHLAGHLQQIEALMSAPEMDMLARLAWQDAQEFRRTSPTVAAMAQALGLTDAQVDQLFITARGIEA